MWICRSTSASGDRSTVHRRPLRESTIDELAVQWAAIRRVSDRSIEACSRAGALLSAFGRWRGTFSPGRRAMAVGLRAVSSTSAVSSAALMFASITRGKG